MSKRDAVSVWSSQSRRENRRPHRLSRPWQLVVAELAAASGSATGLAPQAQAGPIRCRCRVCRDLPES